MKGVVLQTALPTMLFLPVCIGAFHLVSLVSLFSYATPVMFMAMGLGAIWHLILSFNEDGPTNRRVALMLPVAQETRARERWRLEVGTPISLAVAGAVVYHVGLTLHGGTQDSLPRTALLLLWMGTPAAFLSVTDSLGSDWFLRSPRRFLGLLALVLVFTLHPVAFDSIVYWNPEWAASAHLQSWMLAAMVAVCVPLLWLSFSIRLRFRLEIRPKQGMLLPQTAQEPQFLSKRCGFQWWKELPLFKCATTPFITVAFFAFLPLLLPKVSVDDTLIIFFAILFSTRGGQLDWSQNWPSFAKTLVLLHGNKRRVLFGSLLFTGISTFLPLLLMLEISWTEHLYLGFYSSNMLVLFGACIPFVASFVFFAKAYGICGGKVYERRWLYALGYLGLLAMTAAAMVFLVYADAAQALLTFGLVMLPFGVWMHYDVVRRVLADNAYYHESPAE